MLGDIDITKKPLKPNLFLCKPDRTIIGKLNKAYNINSTVNLGKVNELSFDLPYQVDIHHEFKRDLNIDNVLVQYLIKLVYGGFVEWYVIDKISETGDSNGDKKSIHAFSLAYQLANKRMRNYQQDSLTATQQLTATLSETTWSVGTVDPSFDALYRGMDISSNTVLEVIYQIAETFQALVTFDSENKLINLLIPDNYGFDKGLNFKYGKYLKQVGNDIDTSNMVTQLKAYGKDDLTIGAVNPTGSDAIEDLSFFMYPFERDSNKNVLSSSYYMSDSLCNAILDYEELSASKQDEYKSLITRLTDYQTTLTSKQTDLTNLNDQLAIINDNLDLQRSAKTLTIYNFTYTGSSVTKTTTLDPTNDYVVMLSVSDTSNLTVKLDGTTKTPTSSAWVVLGKLSGKSSTSVAFSGSNTDSVVSIYILQITSDEYTASGNDTDLLSKYNDKYEQILINAKKLDVQMAQSNVDSTQSQINTIVNQLSIENNFTTEQIEERDSFIITQEFSDSNYIDAQSLYDAAVKQLKQLQSPPISITIDVVNFLEVVESQREWDKLVLGDKVRISYDMFNLDVKAQITNIVYDFENSTIKLTIANVSEVKDAKQKFLDNLYSGVNASKSVDMSKYKWDQGSVANTDFQNFLNNKMDATKQEITAGVNETVTINGRGIAITDANNPNNVVICQAGVIALSQDGGETWSTAIDPTGVYAQTLIGKIIIGSVLQMENSSGNMTFDDNGLTLTSTDNTKRVLINESDGIKIQQSSDGGNTWSDRFYTDSSGNINASQLTLSNVRSDNKSKIILDPSNGFKIQNSTNNGSTWTDKFYVDTNGNLYAVNLNAQQLVITDGSGNALIDANNKTIDFSKFNETVGTITGVTINGSTINSVVSSSSDNIKLNGGTFTLSGYGFNANDGGFLTSADSTFTISPTVFKRVTTPDASNNTGFNVDYEFGNTPFAIYNLARRNNFGHSGGIVLDVASAVPTIRAVHSDDTFGTNMPNSLQTIQLQDVTQLTMDIDSPSNPANWVNASGESVLLTDRVRVTHGLTTTTTNLYIGATSTGEVRITDDSFYNGGSINYLPIRASSFPTASLEKYKQDITPWNDSAIKILKDAQLYEYRLKSDVENGVDFKRYGFVIGDKYKTPKEVITPDGEAVEQYLMNSLSLKVSQELIEENQQLKDKVEEQEKRLNEQEERLKKLEELLMR